MSILVLKNVYRLDTKKYTVKDIQEEIKECLSIIDHIGIERKNAIYTVAISNRMTKTLGYCKRIKLKPLTFQITISANHLLASDPQEVHDTIMHEVLHSMPECMNHGPKWQMYGKMIQKFEPKYTIERLSTDPTYKQFLQSISKYSISCKSCGWKISYQKRTKSINYLFERKAIGLPNTRYGCPLCKSKELEVIVNNI